jgi:hypothetical protein
VDYKKVPIRPKTSTFLKFDVPVLAYQPLITTHEFSRFFHITMPQNDVVVVPKGGKASLNPAPHPSDPCEFFGVPLREILHRKGWFAITNITQSMENKIRCDDGGIDCWCLGKSCDFLVLWESRQLGKKLCAISLSE